MGIDVAALVNVHCLPESIEATVSKLRVPGVPLQNLAECLISKGHVPLDLVGPQWRNSRDGVAVTIPSSPLTPGVELRLPEFVSLSFSPDAIRVYFLLRWIVVFNDERCQQLLFDAIRGVAHHFGGCKTLVAHDQSDLIFNFDKGMRFDDCLPTTGEVSHVGEFEAAIMNLDLTNFYTAYLQLKAVC